MSRCSNRCQQLSVTIIMRSSTSVQPLRSISKSLGALPAAYAGAQVASRRYAGTIANFKIPTINNEPNVSSLHSSLGGNCCANGRIETLYERLGRPKKASRCDCSAEEAWCCNSTSCNRRQTRMSSSCTLHIKTFVLTRQDQQLICSHPARPLFAR